MGEKQLPHPGHENHLCYLENVGYIDSFPEAYKELIRNGKYMCRVCGRAAARKESLCAPEKL